MNLFVYSDESGVFDKAHNDYFIFGGVIFLSKQERDIASRKYRAAERVIRESGAYSGAQELKACYVKNAEKGKLFRSLNQYHKFAIVVRQQQVMDRIFQNKKDKQRYLDYVYKIGLKRFFEDLIQSGKIVPSEVEGLYVFADEHTTATSGLYELEEALEREYKTGTYNYTWSHFYPPVFPQIKQVKVQFCNSEQKTLVRAADIIANKAYYMVQSGNGSVDALREKMFVSVQP